MERRVRVLVVEDSLTARRQIVDLLAADPACEVVGEASGGEEAIALCARLRPDVITLDMVLADGLTGLDVTERVMGFHPTPILIVSASVNRGEALRTFDALTAGAVDVLEKPRAGEDLDAWGARLVDAVKLVARIKVVTHVRGRLRERLGAPPQPAAARPPAPLQPAPSRAPSRRFRLIAVGASTGGPGAVLQIFGGPPGPPLPVLLVIHLSAAFGAMFAEWLGGSLPVPVVSATDGMPLPLRAPGAPGAPHADARRGQVVVAPPDRHILVEGARIRLSHAPERHGCRPSVDVLFESVAREIGPAAIGVLLTGMGRDGAEGLLAMKRAGAVTLAQDEPTSVVFGMPREAIDLGAADRVLPLSQFQPTLAALAEGAATW